MRRPWSEQHRGVGWEYRVAALTERGYNRPHQRKRNLRWQRAP
jgi:hypothetical protein